ncbi:MAG: PKD domain-containing protein, partial [Moraxellaceae bacterium]
FIMNDRLITLGKSDSNGLFIQNEDHICLTCQANGAPSADFSVDNASPENKHDVTFDASSSSDPNKDQLLYRWDFDGDGVWNTEFTSTATVKYQYLIAGNYSARLQIKDPLGAVASKTLPINVVQSKILPAPIANATDFFDFPVSTGLFDGNSTVYYLDKTQRRLYLLDLASGKANKYFQLDLEPKDMALSLDKKNLYLLLNVRDNAELQIRSIVTIDLAQQAIVSGINVAEPLLSLRDIAGDYFYAQSNRASAVLVHRQTGAITVLNINFGQIFVSETGDIYSYGDGIASYELQGTNLVKTGTLFKDYINWFGSNIVFISADKNFGVFPPYYGIGFTNKERSVVQANATVVKSVADAARNLVFTVSDNGVVDLFNTRSGQRIQTIDIGKKILDVIVQKDKLFFIVAVNNSQSALLEYPHPCLACANNLAPEIKLSIQSEPIQTGKPITLDVSASIDEQIASLLFRWDLNGDGVWDTPFSAQATAQKEFTIPGVKFVSVQAKDIYGETGSKSVVLNATPGVVTAKSEAANNTLATKIASYLNLPVPKSNLFIIADVLKNKLYFYDVLLAQVTQEIDLEYSPEQLVITPDGKTAYVQIVDKTVVNVSSVSDKRYIAKIDVDNYTLSNTFALATGNSLFTALNSERLLTRKDFQEIVLVDSKTGQSLSSATVSPFYSGRSIVVGKDIYIGSTAIYSFENDLLTAKV